MTRPSMHETFMASAYNWARRATCSRLHVGAVLARDGHEISVGYNGAPKGMPHCEHVAGSQERCTLSVHAEVNSVIQAAYEGHTTKGSTLYVTHAPCLACASMLINAGVVAVHYAEEYNDQKGVRLLAKAGLIVWSGADQILADMTYPTGRDAPHINDLRYCKHCHHTVAAHDSGSCGFCDCLVPVS